VIRAEAAGRDPAALEYSRWGQIETTADEVQGRASQGVTRLVVGPRLDGTGGNADRISSCARRRGLG
jgi:hypothetical protein